MTNYSQGKFIDWAFRSKVGGSNGSQRFGSISFRQNSFTYMYAHNYHMTLGPKCICHKEQLYYFILATVN